MDKQKGFTIIELLFVVAIASTLIWAVVAAVNEPNEADPATYQTICLDNHEYWRANLDFGQVLAPKLTDEGYPVICTGDYEN